MPLVDPLGQYPLVDAPITSDASERSLSQHAAVFTHPAEAEQLLTQWGWQENVYRSFSVVEANGTSRPYLYVSVTRFADADGAAEAMPYFIQDLAAVAKHREVQMPQPLGDASQEFVAPVAGGQDVTVWMRSGPLLLRVSGTVSNEPWTPDPVDYASWFLEIMASRPAVSIPTSPALQFLQASYPPDLPACLHLEREETLTLNAMAQRLPDAPDAANQLTLLGWQTGAFQQFQCDEALADTLNWLDLSVHVFANAAGADTSVAVFSQARTSGTQLRQVSPTLSLGRQVAALTGPSEQGTEYTLYFSMGRYLLRVTGVAADSAPQADVEYAMSALYISASSEQGRATLEGGLTTAMTVAATTTVAPTVAAPIPPTATIVAVIAPTPIPAPTSCDPSYPDVCIPPVSVAGDLDCKDVPYGRFRVLSPDPHRFDGPYDGSVPGEPDGIGCEWN